MKRAEEDGAGLEELLDGFEPLPTDVLPAGDVESSEAEKEVVEVEPITYAVSLQANKTDQASGKTRDLHAERRARYRARSKNEMKYLREVVGDLERQLEQFKQPKASSLVLSSSTQVKVWKALAMRQKLEKRKSQFENARLRELLDNQLRFAMQLQHLIAMRETGASGMPSSLTTQRVSIDEADIELFETFFVELDEVFARTDDVLRETGADLRPEMPHRVIRMHNPTAENARPGQDLDSYIEFMDTHMMESDLETARRNSWMKVMDLYLRRRGMLYTPAGSPANVVLLKFKYPYKWIGRDSSVTVTHSVKIFDSPSRQVNVFRAMYVGDGGLAGMATVETGWSVLTSSASDPNRVVCRSIARHSSMRFHRLAPDAPEQAPPQQAEFVRVVFEKGDEDFGIMLNQLSRLSVQAKELRC